jgi:hypothetical protein
MTKEHAELDRMQSAYKEAVEEWIAAIRKEEALASTNHSLAQVDRWEQAHFQEEDARNKVKAAKKRYEAELRSKFFGFK